MASWPNNTVSMGNLMTTNIYWLQSCSSFEVELSSSVSSWTYVSSSSESYGLPEIVGRDSDSKLKQCQYEVMG